MNDPMTELARLLSRVETLERAMAIPQMVHSSIDDGFVEEKDAEGVVTSVWGRQFDGTHALASFNGPPPPRCTPPVLEPYPGGLAVTWDGDFEDGAVAPMDFQRVEAHLSTDPFFTPDRTTLHATFETAQGATVALLLPADTEFYVALVSRSQSGVAGQASTKVAGQPQPLIDQAQFDQLAADLAALDAEILTVSGAATQAQQDAAAAHNAAVAAEGTANAAQAAAAAAEAAAAAAESTAGSAQAAADTALATANGKNTVTWSTSAPSGGGAVGDVWFRLSGAMIIGQWERQAGGWVARTIDDAVIANLNAGKITAGFLDAARIAAGSIATNRLMVGPSNLIADHTFSDAGLRDVRTTLGAGAVTFAQDADSNGGRWYARATGTSNLILAPTANAPESFGAIPVEPLRTYRIGVWVRASADAAGDGIRPAMRILSSSGTMSYVTISGATAYTLPGTVWQYQEWTYATTANVVAVVPAFQVALTAGSILVDSPSFTPRMSSTLIEDGAVTTNRLGANSVTAIKIAAEAVEADKIAANAITAVKIAAGQITADKFAATLVLASTIIVGTAGGNRVEITPTSIRKVSSTGVVSVDIPATGPAVFAGTIRASTFETAEAGVNIDIGGYINAAMESGAISWQVYSPGTTGYTPPHVRGITQTDGAVGTNTLWEASSGAPVGSNTLASRSGLVLKSRTTGGVRSEATLRGQDILLDGDVVAAGTFAVEQSGPAALLRDSGTKSGGFLRYFDPAGVESGRLWFHADGRVLISTANNGTADSGIFRVNPDGQLQMSAQGSGTARPLPFSSAAGLVSVGGIVSNGVADVTVTFPSNRFTQVPIVNATAYDDQGRYTVSVLNRTATGATLRVTNRSAATGPSATVGWAATQMTPTNASG